MRMEKSHVWLLWGGYMTNQCNYKRFLGEEEMHIEGYRESCYKRNTYYSNTYTLIYEGNYLEKPLYEPKRSPSQEETLV